MIDHMPGFGRWVVAQGQVDAAAVLFWLAPAQGGVGLLGFTVVKLARELAVTVGIAGQYDQAGRFPVQPMHDARLGKAVFLQASHQTIPVVFGATGHREQQGGLVDDQQGGVLMDDLNVA